MVVIVLILGDGGGVDLLEHAHQRVPSLLFLHFPEYLLVVDFPHSCQPLDGGVEHYHSWLHFLYVFPQTGVGDGVFFLVENLLRLQVIEAEGALLRLSPHPQADDLFAGCLVDHKYLKIFKMIIVG